MIDYGKGPAADELEISLFGPGLGEAIAVHLGDGVWLLVDSCEAESGRGPETGHYLEQIGVPFESVRAVVATHWHDDHVRALAALVKKCATAQVFVSSVFREEDALAFLATYSGKAAPGQTDGTKELAEILCSRKVKIASCQTYIIDETLGGRNVRVAALSPLPGAISKAAAHLGKYLVKAEQPINKAPPEPSPNAAAIALHVDFGTDAALLGTDLEDNKHWGWTAMMSDPWVIKRPPATAYKVAHHGSHTGDSPYIWKNLLRPQPVAFLTPFVCGRHQLPTDADKNRIKTQAGDTYISSDASRKPAIEHDQLKRLSDICDNVRRVDVGLGAVRLRKKVGDSSWNVELFGAARKL